MQIRFADKKDIPVIQNLVKIIWPQVYLEIISQEQLDYMLNWMYSTESLSGQFDKGHEFLIAEENNIAIGFAAFSPKTSDTVHLQKLYVLPECHGKGIGRSLLNFIIQYVQPKGISSIELNVNRENKAFYFYKKMGFEILRSEDIDIGNGYWMNDYILKLLVNNLV